MLILDVDNFFSRKKRYNGAAKANEMKIEHKMINHKCLIFNFWFSIMTNVIKLKVVSKKSLVKEDVILS